MNNTSIALGFFDGVHIAHQKIIREAINCAEKEGLIPLALTFDKAPLEILTSNKPCYITSNESKASLIQSLGARACFLEAKKDLLDMSPESFVSEILVKKYNIRHAVCGYNYRFGKGGLGDTEKLKELGKKYDFSVTVCDCVTNCGIEVSSTNIRKLIQSGDVTNAKKLLGRNFSLSGTVCEGKHLGSKLGFPTANVFYDANVLMPLNGVYETVVTVNNSSYSAITNIGVNPTVGEEQLRSETFISNFSSDIYGKNINIEFIKFIRREIKFSDLEALKEQIKNDISQLGKGDFK